MTKTAERTIERPRVERPAAPDTKRRSAVALIAMVVAAALLGLGAGYLAWGTSDTDSTAPVAVGDAELTARQEQMVDLIADAEAAWQIGDGDAVAAMFTENGVLTVFGTEYAVDDGALAGYVSTGPFTSLDMLEPMLVSDNVVLSFNTYGSRGTLSDVFEFTPSGELLMTSHDIID